MDTEEAQTNHHTGGHKMGEDKIVKKNVNNLLNKTKGLILSNKNYNNI
jgi:hypothetical protein